MKNKFYVRNIYKPSTNDNEKNVLIKLPYSYGAWIIERKSGNVICIVKYNYHLLKAGLEFDFNNQLLGIASEEWDDFKKAYKRAIKLVEDDSFRKMLKEALENENKL